MSITPADILKVADELSRFSSEAHSRSAASRAYYAAFHTAKSWHDTALPAPGMCRGDLRGRSHEELIERLRHPAPECSPVLRDSSKSAGLILITLRSRRVLADYQLTEAMTRDEAVTAVETAAHLMRDLRTD